MKRRNFKKPKPISRPEKHNRSTRLCGISETFKVNKKRDGVKHPVFSISVAPKINVSRNYNLKNRADRLQEAIAIRAEALTQWPLMTVRDAMLISLRWRRGIMAPVMAEVVDGV